MQRTDLERLLSQIEIFRSLTDEELGLIVDISNQRKFYRNTHIFMQDEPMNHVYFVASGKVKIYRNDPSGREQIVNFFQAGEMFPHHGLFRKDSYPANAITVETSELITIEKYDFEQLLMDHPEVSIKMFRTLGQLIVDLQKRLEDKIFRSTDKQILLLLERLLTNHGEWIRPPLIVDDVHFRGNRAFHFSGIRRVPLQSYRSGSRLWKNGTGGRPAAG